MAPSIPGGLSLEGAELGAFGLDVLEVQEPAKETCNLSESWTQALTNADEPDLPGAAINVPRRPRKPLPEENTIEVPKLPRFNPRCFTCTKSRHEKSDLLPILCTKCAKENSLRGFRDPT